ncbi:hypothetical protein DFH09DRAFT_427811 [Mycena vulgaris]|nr:hypothetical protein DFH09DRAFT_427811 [Mycena vulgaris]
MGDPLVDDSWSIQKGVTMTILQDPLRARVHATGDGEPFEVSPHWHAAHDEQHVVLKGRVQISGKSAPDAFALFTPDAFRHVTRKSPAPHFSFVHRDDPLDYDKENGEVKQCRL